MKNKKHYKKIIYPWDINGYVKISNRYKSEVIKNLINRYNRILVINKKLGLPKYWFNNFKRNEKIKSKDLDKLRKFYSPKLPEDILTFYDDKGSSSIPFSGKFPIVYTPFWHFLYCLSIGDGHIKKGYKNQYIWYQKPNGQRKIIQLLQSLGFYYKMNVKSTKQGITIPQLVNKIGSFVMSLDKSKFNKSELFEATKKLGEKYEIALLLAFFLDEAGMGNKKKNSEITLHQEGI